MPVLATAVVGRHASRVVVLILTCLARACCLHAVCDQDNLLSYWWACAPHPSPCLPLVGHAPREAPHAGLRLQLWLLVLNISVATCTFSWHTWHQCRRRGRRRPSSPASSRSCRRRSPYFAPFAGVCEEQCLFLRLASRFIGELRLVYLVGLVWVDWHRW